MRWGMSRRVNAVPCRAAPWTEKHSLQALRTLVEFSFLAQLPQGGRSKDLVDKPDEAWTGLGTNTQEKKLNFHVDFDRSPTRIDFDNGDFGSFNGNKVSDKPE
jgi:hypothetical protein